MVLLGFCETGEEGFFSVFTDVYNAHSSFVFFILSSDYFSFVRKTIILFKTYFVWRFDDAQVVCFAKGFNFFQFVRIEALADDWLYVVHEIEKFAGFNAGGDDCFEFGEHSFVWEMPAYKA